MIAIKNNQVFSTDDKYVHRIGSDSFFKRGIILKTDTVEDYEEVDEIPVYTKDEYNDKVNELIRLKYSQAEENAIKRKMINAMFTPNNLSEERFEYIINEYTEFNNYVEECLSKAKDSSLYNINEQINGKEG